MINDNKNNISTINNKLIIKDQRIKKVDSFKYVGSFESNDCKFDKEINNRIIKMKVSFNNDCNIRYCNIYIDFKTKLLTYVAKVLSTELYACEGWFLSKDMIKKLETTQLYLLRRIF